MINSLSIAVNAFVSRVSMSFCGIDIKLIKLPRLENSANTYMWHTERWTAVLTLLGLISSAYRDLHHWRSNQQSQNAETEVLQLSRHIRSCGHALLPWLVDLASLMYGMDWWPSGKVSVSAFCGCLFDLQWWRPQYAKLMRPNKVKKPVQSSLCRILFAEISSHDNLINIYIYIYIY